MKHLSGLLWGVLVIVVAYFVAYYELGTMVTHPGKALMGVGGDTIKNYYVFVTHALHGNGWLFKGMNYPYGEQLIFVDGMPALSIPLTWLRSVVSLDINDVTAVLNMYVVISFILAILYTYKVLRAFNVNNLFALTASVLIVAMSPQTSRSFGHFGLAFLCYLPIVFYYTLLYFRTGKYRYLIINFCLSLFAMYLHPYMIAVMLVFSCFYMIGYLLLFRLNIKQKLKHTIPVLLVPVACLVIFKIVLSVIDTAADRPETPWGILQNCTTGLNIVTSELSFVWQYFTETGIIYYISDIGEGYAYTGIVVLVIIFIVIVALVKNIFRSVDSKKKILNDEYKLFAFVSLTALLLGMGVPFIWGMDWLFELFPPFKQFRSMGRFSLIYYNVISILAVALLYRWSYRLIFQRKKYAAISIVVLMLVIWAGEAYTYATNMRKHTDGSLSNYRHFTSENMPDAWNRYLEERGFKGSDFQAVLGLPYVHIGSEKIWVAEHDWGGFCILTNPCYQLDLPMINANMSRSSWQQTFDQVKISAGPFAEKPILDTINSDKPFLLLVFNEATLNPNERYMISLADSIGVRGQQNVYSLSPNALHDAQQSAKEYVLQIVGNMSSRDTSFPGNTYFYDSFDDDDGQYVLAGKGSDAPLTKDNNEFLHINVSDWPKRYAYEFSYWALVPDDTYESPLCVLFQYDVNGNELSRENVWGKESADNHGFWFRISRFVKLHPDCVTLTAGMINPDDGAYMAMDELLIYNTNDTVIHKADDGKLMANNHLLKTD